MVRRAKPKPSATALQFDMQAVCKHEINAAAEQLIDRDNLVACHLLVSAAREIISGIAKREEVRLTTDLHGILSDAGVDRALIDEVNYYTRLPYNSVKHSNGARSEVTFFDRTFVEACLLCGIFDYRQIFGRITSRMGVAAAYLSRKYPDLTTNPATAVKVRISLKDAQQSLVNYATTLIITKRDLQDQLWH